MLKPLLAAFIALALLTPATAKKAKPAEQTFTAIMKDLAGMGDVIAANKIKILVLNDDKARAAATLVGEIIGAEGTAKDTITHVIMMSDERQTLFMVFEGEKILAAQPFPPKVGEVFFAEWARRNV